MLENLSQQNSNKLLVPCAKKVFNKPIRIEANNILKTDKERSRSFLLIFSFSINGWAATKVFCKQIVSQKSEHFKASTKTKCTLNSRSFKVLTLRPTSWGCEIHICYATLSSDNSWIIIHSNISPFLIGQHCYAACNN